MLRTMILLLVLWAIVIATMTSCSVYKHNYPEDVLNYNKDCVTEIELRNGTKFEHPEDSDNMIAAEEGCIRKYGINSCLVRFIKTGKLSYYAICSAG